MNPVFIHRNSMCSRVALALAIVCVSGSFSAWSAEPEKVTLHLPGGKFLRCEILKITKSEVLVKPEGEKEQALPFGLITPQEVSECYKLAMEPKNAALRFAMGTYFAKKELYAEAKTELAEAARLDGSLKDKAEELLKKIPDPSAPPPVKTVAEPKKAEDKPVAVADKTDKSKPVPPKPSDTKPMSESDSSEKADEDFRKKFMRKEVAARTEAQMKEFLDKRLEELNAKLGGKWRLIETKHFFCFANIAEDKHKMIAQQWNETLYDLLCRVLNHKEGEKLWNNKMPIYYFDTFKQFQKFAVEIDKSPGAAYSGGYFASQGREVHICIPFMSERLKTSPARMDEEAHGTLFHEGTHAFLQLSGEDVELSRWLHEGMAQFIEFWYESEKYPGKRDRMANLRDEISRNKGTPPTWEEMADRPRSGMDGVGYSCAYTRLEFLYRNFDNQRLPQFIHLVKSGKPEKEALETVFKFPEEKLEEVYKTWVKENLKRNFKFN